ncbi:MAG: bifunctional glycosyltransferase family 2/GtrA family protein [Thermoguttaceae bacterium]|nr:bifunctional glycosyltransferase family 2/GtrA family protein [Thermoguttaceae bacterium]
MQQIQKVALIPAYKPPDALVGVARALAEKGFRLIVIDDGNGEEYAPIFNEVAHWAMVLHHEINRGKGRAIKTGLDYLVHEGNTDNMVVVTVDADGQHRPEDVLRVTQAAIDNQATLITGRRDGGSHVPIRSKIGNAITRCVYRCVTGRCVTDTQTGLRAFDSSLLSFMQRVSGERYEYEMNVLLECSAKSIPIVEVPIETVYFDENASSHFCWLKDSVRIYWEVVRFALSSMAGFLVDYGLFCLLIMLTHRLGTVSSIIIANVGARIVSASVNFFLNKKYVFGNRAGILKTAIGYFSLAVGILIGNTLVLRLLVQSCRVNKFLAKLLTEAAFFLISWLVQHFFVFRRTSETRL